MIRLLLADDQDVVREGLRTIFSTIEGVTVVAEAADGLDAVRLAARERPDVVVMDIRMPHMDGITATQQILATGPDAPRVLVLTVFGEDEYVYEALRAGASGFLLKDASRDELAAAVRTVARGDQVLSPRVVRGVIEQYVARRPRPPGTPPELAALSARELEIVACVARGLSNADIAQELFLGVGTVKTHVAHILAKLGLRDRVQIVVLAYECGYALSG